MLKTAAPIPVDANGLLAASAQLSGSPITWPGSEKVRIDAAGALTVSLWIKPEATASGTLFKWGAVALTLQGGKLGARIDKASLSGGDIKPLTWTQAALTVGGGKAALYLNGVEVARGDAPLPALSGALQVGEGIQGLADELQIANTVRSAEWLRVAAGAQGAESKLVASVKETGEAAEEGAHPGYMGILVKNLTTDAWAVIIILGVMFVIACWVMVTKTVFVVRADKDNRKFLKRFRGATLDMLHLAKSGTHPNSSLFRLYMSGVRELKKRDVGVEEQAHAKTLSGASLNAVKASIDADLVRESHRLNAQMVFLTIAISGGPFLGLLGTVVGVMITFAAIAAAGDVNVNAIAPGIAAALLATVAGLGGRDPGAVRLQLPRLAHQEHLVRHADLRRRVRDPRRRESTAHAEQATAMSGDVKAENQPYDEINVTPMLDLAYVLLVVFIILTTASVQGVKVNSPTTDAANSLAQAADPGDHDHGRWRDLSRRLPGHARPAEARLARPATRPRTRRLPVVLKADSARAVPTR